MGGRGGVAEGEGEDVLLIIVNVGCLKRVMGWGDEWYFLLAEARKKQKMFSHTPLGPVY